MKLSVILCVFEKMRKGEEFIVCNCVLYSIKLQLLTITVGYHCGEHEYLVRIWTDYKYFTGAACCKSK